MADEMIDSLIDDEEDGDSQKGKYLIFKLGPEEYGIDISKVQGIEEIQRITHVPDMPAYVKGVVNLRGDVFPVIDMRTRFGMEFRDYDDRTCLILVNVHGRRIGCIVDTVTVVSDVEDRNIEPPPTFKEKGQAERFISGLAKIGDEVKILIDTDLIIGDEVLDMHQKEEVDA